MQPQSGIIDVRGVKAVIEYARGDILKCEAEALVNTVNCVGVMGRGIALQFKNAYPDNFKAYAAACRKEEIRPGRMFVFETGSLLPPRYIVNFPTKRHWRGKSRIEDIEAGLRALRGSHSRAKDPLDRHPAARQRARRTEMVRREGTD